MKKLFILLLSVIASACLFVGCSNLSSNSSLTSNSSSTSSSLQDDSANYLMFVSVTNGYFVYDCDSSSKIVVIPEKHKGENVVGIFENAFKDCKQLKSVTIPNSVTSIGNSAFSNCSSLTNVTIPNSVTSIGSYAFYNCPIETATLPTNCISSIGKGNLKYLTINGGESIGDSAFENCSSLTSVTIGDSVTSIGRSAFWGCSSLTSVTILNSVTSIGDAAFYNCSSLTSVTIPDSVTSIGGYAFCYCSSLTSVNFINKSGWFVCDDSSATSGTNILSEDLQDTSTAATYLKSIYYDYYWKRNV